MLPSKPSTESAPSPKEQKPLPTRSCLLFVVLDVPNHQTKSMEQTTYRLRKLGRKPGVIPPAWTLTKLTEHGGDSDQYTVHRDSHGYHCTCMDNIARREPTGTHCKHVSALTALGLLGDDLA